MQYSRMFAMGGMVLAGVFGGALGAVLIDSTRVQAQGAGVVTTTQLNLVDSSGQLRAVLAGRDERGMASLSFYDASGQVRSVLGIDDTGVPVLRLLTATGESRIQAMLQGDDALLIVGEESGRTGILGSVGGSPVLSFGNAERARARLQLGADGSPLLSLFDSTGQRATTLSVDGDESPFLTLYEQGRSRAALGIVQQAVVLNMSDTSGPRLVLGVADDGWPSVNFIDENGNVVQELPLPTVP